jgi:hypothetical protein
LNFWIFLPFLPLPRKKPLSKEKGIQCRVNPEIADFKGVTPFCAHLCISCVLSIFLHCSPP